MTYLNPLFSIAVLTRSFDSFTTASGNPTMMTAGCPPPRVHLNLNRAGINAEHRRGMNFGKHGRK